MSPTNAAKNFSSQKEKMRVNQLVSYRITENPRYGFVKYFENIVENLKSPSGAPSVDSPELSEIRLNEKEDLK